MAAEPRIQVRGFALNEVEERHIRRHLDNLMSRLAPHGEPIVTLVLDWHPTQRLARASLRARLGHLGRRFASSRSAETANLAVRKAVESIERRFERQLAVERGEPTYGVPSRRSAALSGASDGRSSRRADDEEPEESFDQPTDGSGQDSTGSVGA